MGCNKKPFNSPGEARKRLRVWQRKGRRKELDTVHVYACESREHKGKYHVGHTDNNRKGGQVAIGIHKRRWLEKKRQSPVASRKIQELDELDDFFTRQTARVKGQLAVIQSRHTKRMNELDGGPLTGPMQDVTSGDVIDVRTK